MIQGSVSRGNENAADPCLRKKVGSEHSKGLKQRSRALNDVKNTLQSHASNVTGKSKSSQNQSNITSKPTFTKSVSTKQSPALLTNKKVLSADENHPVCPNHHLCTIHEDDFLDDLKLSKKEIDFFGNRMRFFDMATPPVKTTAASALDDVEIIEPRKYSIYDEEDIMEDSMCLEVPKPSFY